jgi:D-arabinose 1-dehydrogenase-like Zn-dependent alcohol dehydrogenase
LAPRATIYLLSVGYGDLKMPYMPILLKELKIQGLMVAARQVHRDMLEFAAHHHVLPIIEQFPMTVDVITEAMQKLEAGKMQYRGVLVAQ